MTDQWQFFNVLFSIVSLPGTIRSLLILSSISSNALRSTKKETNILGVFINRVDQQTSLEPLPTGTSLDLKRTLFWSWEIELLTR